MRDIFWFVIRQHVKTHEVAFLVHCGLLVFNSLVYELYVYFIICHADIESNKLALAFHFLAFRGVRHMSHKPPH